MCHAKLLYLNYVTVEYSLKYIWCTRCFGGLFYSRLQVIVGIDEGNLKYEAIIVTTQLG
jgi:hypothetical protein